MAEFYDLVNSQCKTRAKSHSLCHAINSGRENPRAKLQYGGCKVATQLPSYKIK